MTAIAEATDRARAIHEALLRAGELTNDDRVVDVAQLSGGWSRHSYVAHAERADGERRRYIVRVEAPGGVLETDIATEYALYHALEGTDEIATPSVFHFDAAKDNAFANRFIVMEAVDGHGRQHVSPARPRVARGATGTVSAAIATDMVENVARLHRFPTDATARRAPSRGSGFVDVVDRWQTVYEEKHLGTRPGDRGGVRVAALARTGRHADRRRPRRLPDRQRARPRGPRVSRARLGAGLHRRRALRSRLPRRSSASPASTSGRSRR